MSLEIIKDPPSSDAFTPLAEHQSQTPTSFFDGKPVLYHQCSGCRILVSKGQTTAQSPFPLLTSTLPAPNGDSEGEPSLKELSVVLDVDLWVTSERLTLYSTAAKTGIAIPYPNISLHAIQRLTPPLSDEEVQGLYMQLSLNETENLNADEDFETLELTLIPSAAPALTTASAATEGLAAATSASESEVPIRSLFSAVSSCADLHPDPDPSSDGDQDEDTAETAPGAGGWITSDNMHEYFDEDGQFVGLNNIPAVAGTVRPRDELREEEDTTDGDTKWQRTD